MRVSTKENNQAQLTGVDGCGVHHS